jgi:hypothetical protein
MERDMHINIRPTEILSTYINAGGGIPFLVVDTKHGWLAIDKSDAIKLRRPLDEFIAYEPTPVVAEAATDESVLGGEDHSDDDTVLYADADKAILEQTTGGAA